MMFTPIADVLGVLAGLIDVGVGLFVSFVDPTVSIVGRVFAFLSAVLNSIFVFRGM